MSDDSTRRALPPADAPIFDSLPRRRARARGGDGPQAVSELIMPTLARLGLKTKARHLQLMNAWPQVVGEVVAAGTNPVAYSRGRLTVHTDSPALGHQLKLQKQLIIDGLNAAVGERIVTDVYFRLGPSR